MFVDELVRDVFWQRHPADLLSDWRRLDTRLPPGSPVRARELSPGTGISWQLPQERLTALGETR
jgi:hypothetical protein